jgi:diadenosine tetraphosphate (Ap4A) HIT family hydrolase
VSCLACEVASGRVRPSGGTIYEDDFWQLAHSVSPVQLDGWLVLVSKRHVTDVGALTADEAAALGPIVARASAALQSVLGAERVYVCSLGREPHLHVHFHFVPRRPGMPEAPLDVFAAMWSEQSPWACGDEKAAAVAEAVRRAWR